MKKTFITPKAEVKALASVEMICGSTPGVNETPAGGSEGDNYIAPSKMGGFSTLARGAAWAAGKMDF